MLDALRFGADERPRLVHRLDKDTSGVLVLARGAAAAARLAAAFRAGQVRKIYWAATVGVPKPAHGRIERSLGKVAGQRGERMTPVSEGGRRASTLYRVVERAGKMAAWLALEPLTGRTHQLRVHCIGLGTPILGDGKYGGREAFLAGGDFARALHLHARALRITSPGGGVIDVQAPLPSHMRDTWRFLGFDEGGEEDPFAGFAG
jgi:23S rRNA pseudouridine955/2504/2580 synthase